MTKALLRATCSTILIVLALLPLPNMGLAQGGWPPLEIETSLHQQDANGAFRYDVLLRNVSNIDLADLIVTSTLPQGVAFNRFESMDYATTGFDGKDMSFTVLRLPAGKSVGPMAVYVEIEGVDPDTLKTALYAQWQGQMPGSVFVPDARMGGGTVDASATETPPPTSTPPATATPEPPTEEPEPTPQEQATAGAGTTSLALWDLLAALESHEIVDLTNTFAPGIPRWPGFPDAEFKTIYDYDSDGFFAQEFVHVGQYGTHMDAPSHFHKGLRALDEIGLDKMMAPLVVIDVSGKVAANPDYELTVDDVKAWEAKHGPIPAGALVAMRSDWSERWPDVDAYFNKDAAGQAHYPGWTVDALKYLYEERGIVGNGHETPDTDAALAQVKTGFAAETYVLGTNHYQIELMANLDRVPETGAIVFAIVPKPRNGSGFPARVFAVLP